MYVRKLKLATNSICSLCNSHEEDIEHLFCKCSETSKLWDNLQEWIINKIGMKLLLTDPVKILRHLKNDDNFWPLNLIIMATKNVFSSVQQTTTNQISFPSIGNFKKNIFQS